MHWKEILPSDQYIAYMNRRLHETDRDVLTLLYQPLIGATAYSLYMTLTSDVSRQPGKRIERTHKALMAYTEKHLDEIFKERKKLEAIGLLKVFRKKQGEEYIHYYELQSPLSPEEFFNDDMLSVFLYNRLGSREHYLQLRNTFKLERENGNDRENITRSFDEVFTSVHPSEITINPETEEVLLNKDRLEGAAERESGYKLEGHDFDFESMLAFLPPFVPKDEVKKKENKTLIQRMAFLYKLSPSEVSKIIQDAMIHTDELNGSILREQAKRRYRMNESDQPPRLHTKVQPENLRVQKTEPVTEEEMQIHYFETTSPLEYLQEQANGAKVYPGDLDIIDQLMFEYKLEPGVVNVLLEYIFIMHGKKLTRNFTFKIASHWSREGIRTVKEAMDFTRKQYEQTEQNKQQKDTSKSTKKGATRNQAVRQEPLPKWMADEEWNKSGEKPEDLEEARKKAAQLKEMLKKKKQGG